MLEQGTYTSTAADSTWKVPDLMLHKEAAATIRKLKDVMDEQEQVVINNRHLRYTEIDLEAERKAGRIAPDELYIPQHIIDTNIRREQAIYIGYVTQASRAAIFTNKDDPTIDGQTLERDFTMRVRYDGWQIPLYRAIDGMQMNGYSIVEIVHDQTKPGHMALQDVAYGDFGYSLDSRDLQACEMVTRRYRFTKTQLLAMANKDTWGFSLAQVQKVVCVKDSETNDYKEQSLYKVEKVMFRKKGVVQVAWSCAERCDDWLRAPRPLYIGRLTLDPSTGSFVKAFETTYPYYVVPYSITENTEIRQIKGRAYLDQDYQEGVSSLMSSFVTAHRRASYLVFSKDSENDPNSDVITQSNIAFKAGAVINSKVKQFQLAPPDATMLSSIQALASSNLQENSQINYAAQNRQDSRKTAREIEASTQSSQQLSQIQIAMFSSALKAIYLGMYDVIRSRVMGGLIEGISDALINLYSYNWALKPAGDVDVVERQQKIQAMLSSWGVISATPAAQLFLNKLLTLMFPDDAPQYIQAMGEDQRKTQVLMACGQVLAAMVQDPAALSPQEQQNIPQIKQLLQKIQIVVQPPQQGGKQQPPQQPQKQLTQGQPA